MSAGDIRESAPAGLVAALDVGGTSVRGGLFAMDGSLFYRTQAPTGGTPGDIDPELRTCRTTLQALADEAGRRGYPLRAVGAGFPEYVHEGRLRSHEVLAWTRQPAEIFREDLGLEVEVTIESDVRCGAVAEAQRGAGRGAHSVAYLSWGTGLSSSIVQDDRLVVGARGEAIGIGEFPVPGSLDPGWSGNLERFASGKGIQARYEAATGEPVDGARGVVLRIQEGDDVARDIADSAADAVGVALGAVVALLDPSVIVLGGGIGSDCEGYLATHARLRYETETGRRPSPPPLVTATLGADAGLIGAALATGALYPHELATG